MTAASVYRILALADWERAQADGRVAPNADDARDGFIHLSGHGQVRETARRHYAEAGPVVVLEIAAAALGEALVWEPSRGGEDFPHLYGELPVSAVAAVLSLDAFP